MSKRAEKTKVLQVSEVEKEIMRVELRRFRTTCGNLSMRERLQGVPISYCERLFNLEDNFPCESFGKQLVLKIVDELLD